MDLTREQILTLEAGRELDALIAEHLFGFTVHKSETWAGPRYTTNGPQPDGKFHIGVDVLEYSTDISAAWEVVEKIKEMGHEWYLSPAYCFTIVDDNGEPEENHRITLVSQGVCDSAPLAICRAALLAVLNEKE